MENKKEVEKSVRAEIRKHLSQCSEGGTPKVFALLQTPEGYRKIESMIIFILIYDQITIGAAISNIEAELI